MPTWVQLAEDIADKAPTLQTGISQVLSYHVTKVLLGPVVNDVPKAYADFTAHHQKLRNLTFITITWGAFIAGLVLAFVNKDYQATLDKWLPVPEILSFLPDWITLAYRGPQFASYLTAWISDALFKIIAAFALGDREFHLERIYCEEYLLPQAHRLALEETAHALDLTPEQFKETFLDIRVLLRKEKTKNMPKGFESILQDVLKAFMTRNPAHIATVYNKYKDDINRAIETAQIEKPHSLLAQFHHMQSMRCKDEYCRSRTTYGTVEVDLSSETRATRPLLADWCPL